MLSFENCLGKHTDTLEHALTNLSGHIRNKAENRFEFVHEDEVDLEGARTGTSNENDIYSLS